MSTRERSIGTRARYEIAIVAEADPRTVRRVELGRPVRPTTAARIRRAAEQLGYELPLRDAEPRK